MATLGSMSPQRRGVVFVYWSLGTRAESALPLSKREAEIAVLPHVGDAYWHDLRAHRIVEVTNREPPEIHVELDEARDDAFYGALPDGAIIDAGRDGDDGRWHADVYENEEARANHRSLGWDVGKDCDSAVGGAVARANEVLASR